MTGERIQPAGRPQQIPALTVRPERLEDREAISAVVAAAFGSPAEARLVEAIRGSENFIPELSLVAALGDHIVGHVMISYVGLDTGGGFKKVPSLSPLAVAPSLQGQGIGSALVRSVTAAADRRGEPLIVLEGNPRYYARFGFEHSAPLGIEISLPSWAPPEAAQVLRLGAYRPVLRGRVVYPPAFDAVTSE